MRTLAMPVLAVAMMLAAPSAQAQTYDPNYPICLQTFGRMVTPFPAAIHRCSSADGPRRAGRRNASSTLISPVQIRAGLGNRGRADNRQPTDLGPRLLIVLRDP